MYKKIIFLAVLLLSLANFAYAAPITITFTANNFVLVAGSGTAPTDPVTGTIVYDAADVHSPINSLISINLTINGHTYAVGDLAFLQGAIIGGSLNGANSIVGGTNDFYIEWNPTTLEPELFSYADPSANGIWQSNTFSNFSVTGPGATAAVPTMTEWGMIIFMVLAGLGSIHYLRRQKQA